MSTDFLIIGGGPAGIAAAIQAARLGLSTTIVERDRLGGQANAAPWIENYPGFPEGITGKELMTYFERQLKKWPVKIIFDEAKDIESYNAKCVLLAVGLTPKLAGIPGEIPYGDPDRIDHAGKDVLVIGGGDSAFDLAWSFAKKARGVTIGMRSGTPRALPKLVDRAISSRITIKTGWRPSDASYEIIISCIGKEAKHPLIEKTKKAKGLFLAGDICHSDDRHIAIAAEDGISAAQSACRFLNKPQRHRETEKCFNSNSITETQRYREKT